MYLPEVSVSSTMALRPLVVTDEPIGDSVGADADH